MSAHVARFVPPYADRFTSCWELFAISESLVQRQHDANLATVKEGDYLVWGAAASSIKTYKAALLLAALGHGTQAVMLDRSLIENALVIHWADRNRAEALRLMALHARNVDHGWRAVFEARDLDLGTLASVDPLTECERREIQASFGRYGNRSWTGLSTYELYRDVRESWVDDNEMALLDHVFAVNLRYANLRLHSSVASMVFPDTTSGTTELYEAGESSEDISVALLLSFWAFAHALRAILAEPFRAELLRFYQSRMPTFFRA